MKRELAGLIFKAVFNEDPPANKKLLVLNLASKLGAMGAKKQQALDIAERWAPMMEVFEISIDSVIASLHLFGVKFK